MPLCCYYTFIINSIKIMADAVLRLLLEQGTLTKITASASYGIWRLSLSVLCTFFSKAVSFRSTLQLLPCILIATCDSIHSASRIELNRAIRKRLLICVRTTIGFGSKRLFILCVDEQSFVHSTTTGLSANDYWYTPAPTALRSLITKRLSSRQPSNEEWIVELY